MQLPAHLQQIFPHIDVGGAPEALGPMLEKHGKVFDSPQAHCDKARAEHDLLARQLQATIRPAHSQSASVARLRVSSRS